MPKEPRGKGRRSSPNQYRTKLNLSLGRLVRFSKVSEYTFDDVSIVPAERRQNSSAASFAREGGAFIFSVILHWLFGSMPPPSIPPPSS
jgi:hypothetical protein